MVPPSALIFLPSRVEAIIGGQLYLPVQVQGYINESEETLLAFTDCRRLNVEVSSTDGSVFNVSVESDIGKELVCMCMCMRVCVL